MSKPVSQKREYCDKNGVFNGQWTMQFLFIKSNGKPLCLICQKAKSVVKEYNLKRHYKSGHEAKYENIRGQEIVYYQRARNYCLIFLRKLHLN